MLISKTAYRFAKSLLQLSIERNELEKVMEDMKLVNSACIENREMLVMLESPVIKTDKKRNIFKMIFDGKIDTISMTFFDIIFRRSREKLVLDITQSFINQYKEFKKIHIVTVLSAAPLSAENRKEVMEYLRTRTTETIELVEKIDESLIGGIIIKMDDLQIDASVKNNLNKLDREFSQDLYSVKL